MALRDKLHEKLQCKSALRRVHHEKITCATLNRSNVRASGKHAKIVPPGQVFDWLSIAFFDH